MADPDKIVKRILTLNANLAGLQADVEKVSVEREGLIRELRSEGWSLGRIAGAAGLSRGRIQQIVSSPLDGTG